MAAWTVISLCLVVIVGGGSCAEGDDDSPGRVSDLHCFWVADALNYNGRVSEGDTSGPANTRILAWSAPGDDDYSPFLCHEAPCPSH